MSIYLINSQKWAVVPNCDFCNRGNRQNQWWCFGRGGDVDFAVILDDGDDVVR